jgi:large repetitive protein
MESLKMRRKAWIALTIALTSLLLLGGCDDDSSQGQTTGDTSATDTTGDGTSADTSGSTTPDTSGGDTSGVTNPVCGNSVREGSEECDDGDSIQTNGCRNDCTLPFCGDNLVSVGEECDPPTVGFCDNICRLVPTSMCGNNIVDDGEACDDGNTASGDGCRANCTAEECGDGIQDVGEACDDGASNSDTAANACRTDCQMPSCGDGVQDNGEACDDGNTTSNDGCSSTCTPDLPSAEVQIIDCAANLPAPTAEVCQVTAGSAVKLITGDILRPNEVLRGGQVLVNAAGQITCAACDCSGEPEAAGATLIVCPDGAVSPGLINAHDHITYIQNSPYTDTGERYEHRHDWRRGLRGHTELTTPGSASTDAKAWGELRFILGGATSIVGSGSSAGLLRNLDQSGAGQEGLNLQRVRYETFPLGDTSGNLLTSGCGYPNIITEASIAGDDAYFPHVSEGIDAAARNEFICLSGAATGGQDHLEPQSAYIHSIALLATDYAAMATEGTALIWSPRSNITLYGDTAQVTTAHRLGVLIALGTDWVATGSMNVLRELRCAADLNESYYNNFFTDEQLWRMVTVNAATAASMEEKIGVLATGRAADISIFNAHGHKDFRAVIDAQPQDVALVMRAGKVLYGDSATVTTIPGATGCDTITVCGSDKRACVQSEVGKSLSALTTGAGGGIYPLFFCGEPNNEPSCVPARAAGVNGSTVFSGVASATDNDGDGIPNASDNCPDTFNPIRPLDNGAQADHDSDGDGDVCDPCPLNPNTTSCSAFNPDDQDSDGVPNLTDNCPTIYNPDQTADADADGKGDACDSCPRPNPGSAPCPNATIYEIKRGTLPPGEHVELQNLLVTGKGANGLFVQVKATDTTYDGADHSGLFIFTGTTTNAIVPGNRISIADGSIQDFFGQTQLSNVTGMTITNAAVEAAPAPVTVTTAEATTNGSRADALEGVVVQVSDVTVAALDAAFNEFIINDDLRVDDFLYLTSPLPAVTDRFSTITGVLAYRNNASKLLPRQDSDLVYNGAASLVSFLPSSGTFARQGTTSVATFPQPLTVSLARAAATDTFVSVMSSDPAITIPGGGVTIPAGQTSAPVLVTATAQAPSVTLTATLDADSFPATVRVLGAAEQPTTLASLTPSALSILVGGSASFTATIDIPAPPGGTSLNLNLSPANAGTLNGAAAPTTATIPANQTSVTIDYIDAAVAADITLDVSLPAANTRSATITAGASVGGFVINEIDYDQAGTDATEYVELYNGTSATIDLSNYEVVFVNGNSATAPAIYGTISLASAGTLPAGGYLVLGSANVVADPSAITLTITNKGGQASLDPTGIPTDIIQNGARDGVALINTSTGTLTDALAYEGSFNPIAIPSITSGPVSFVEGTLLPATVADANAGDGSLIRNPNGADSDDAATDWTFTLTPTPGTANTP